MKKFLYILLAVVAVFAIIYAFSGKSHATQNKALVAYFSATGHTAAVADRLAGAINADVFVIEPEKIYTADDLDWKNQKSRSSVEMADRSSRPAIANKIENIEQYDVIFVGFPIWWGREPSIVDTFIEGYNFAGKTIVPFATSGSTPTTDEAAASIQQLAPDARVLTGKRFPTDVSVKELKSWAGEWL